MQLAVGAAGARPLVLPCMLSHFLPAWDFSMPIALNSFPAPMTQELGLTPSLIPYASISDYENMATRADSMDEVRGDGKEAYRQIIPYVSTINCLPEARDKTHISFSNKGT